MHCTRSLSLFFSLFLKLDDVTHDVSFVIIHLMEIRSSYLMRVCALLLPHTSLVHFILCAYKQEITNNGSRHRFVLNSAVYIIHHLLAPLFSFALPSLFFLNKIRDREKKVEIYTHTHTHTSQIVNVKLKFFSF